MKCYIDPNCARSNMLTDTSTLLTERALEQTFSIFCMSRANLHKLLAKWPENVASLYECLKTMDKKEDSAPWQRGVN